MSKARTKLLAVHVTLLEMKQMPTYRVTSPTGARMALMRVADMPLSFYRYRIAKSVSRIIGLSVVIWTTRVWRMRLHRKS